MLDGLPSGLREYLLARMEAVEMRIGTVLSNPGERPQYAHFMTSGVTSIVTFMGNGSGAEVQLIGREGLVEAINLLGPGRAPSSAFVQVKGTALRMKFAELQKEVFAHRALLLRVLESVQCQAFILSQLAACNRLHEIDARLARWLLMVQDRQDSEKFYLTQEFLAQMIGARRTSVTLAAGGLQKLGLIEYRRGNITVVNRAGLVEAACECYPIVRDLAVSLYRPPSETETFNGTLAGI